MTSVDDSGDKSPTQRSSSKKRRWMAKKLTKVEAECRLLASSGKNEIVSTLPRLESSPSNVGDPTSTTQRPPGNAVDQRRQLASLKRERHSLIMPKFYSTISSSRADGGVVGLGDIYDLLLYSILGGQAPRKPKWCELTQWRHVSQTIFVIVDQTDANADGDPSEFPFLQGNFLRRFDVKIKKGVDGEFYDGLFRVELPLISVLREKTKSGTKPYGDDSDGASSGLTKVDLLLSPVEMAEEGFPLPAHYCYYAPIESQNSRMGYTKPTADSPIYAVDCEMCMTGPNRRELTRISILDEDCKIVLDTLVRTEYPITDYLTRFSGITPTMMANVTTTLSDVRRAVETILEPDAILCGHSLQFDLQPIGIFHPHVIDTSVSFNLSGSRRQKSALRVLASTFLDGMRIQQSDSGHCSVEDAYATMRLLKKKLAEGQKEDGDRSFGNVADGWNFHAFQNEQNSVATSRKRKLESDNSFERVSKRRRIDRNSKRKAQCDGCQLQLQFNCRNDECACRNLDRASCLNCLVRKKKVDPNTAADPDAIVKELFPPLGPTSPGDDRASNLVDVASVLKNRKKKLLWIRRGESASNADDGGNDNGNFERVVVAANLDGAINANEAVLRHFQSSMFKYDLNVLELRDKSGHAKLSSRRLDSQIESIVKCSASKSLICVLFCDRGENDQSDRESGVGKCYLKIKD